MISDIYVLLDLQFAYLIPFQYFSLLHLPWFCILLLPLRSISTHSPCVCKVLLTLPILEFNTVIRQNFNIWSHFFLDKILKFDNASKQCFQDLLGCYFKCNKFFMSQLILNKFLYVNSLNNLEASKTHSKFHWF